jgi:uncharacterized membrane protein YqaE (UPF0057 family)
MTASSYSNLVSDNLILASEAVERNNLNHPTFKDLQEAISFVLTLIMPPLGVLLRVGFKNKHFWINILATSLFFLPGIMHGVWLQGSSE